MAVADSLTEHQTKLAALRASLAQVIRGKDEAIELIAIAVAAGGSILMEDVPGVGKTTLAKALARSLDVVFRRIQFTPDLLPADILGSSIYSPADGTFHFRPGPIFCNILLADEINRASPRTQSALLEAMSERQVTIEGERHELTEPFVVIATQNPVEYQGTYPLPEAQLDRFLVQIALGYPTADTEVEILFAHAAGEPVDATRPVLDHADVAALQAAVRSVRVSPALAGYVIAISRATRDDARLQLGVSPRASLMLFRAAQAAALSAGRDYVLPDDIQRMAGPVLAHRLILTQKARYGGAGKQSIVEELVARVRVPV